MRCRERRTDAKTIFVPATYVIAKTDLSYLPLNDFFDGIYVKDWQYLQ
jgi:hypothetical protein